MATVRLERELAGTKRTRSRYVFACVRRQTRSYVCTRLDALTGVLETGGRHQNHRLCSATGAAFRPRRSQPCPCTNHGANIIRLSLRPSLSSSLLSTLAEDSNHSSPPSRLPRGQTNRESLSVTKCNAALINVTASVVGGLRCIGKEDCLPIGNRGTLQERMRGESWFKYLRLRVQWKMIGNFYPLFAWYNNFLYRTC